MAAPTLIEILADQVTERKRIIAQLEPVLSWQKALLKRDEERLAKATEINSKRLQSKEARKP